MQRLLFLIATIFALGAEPALAQQPEKPEAKPEAPAPKAAKAKAGRDRVCAEDAKKFCSEVRPGGGRMYQCLSKNSAELAPACRERLAAGKARWDAFVSACKSDAGKYCKGIPAGGARVLSCLKGREADLAPDCKAQFGRASRDPVVTQ